MKIAICDDDPVLGKRLQRLLSAHDKKDTVLLFESAEALLREETLPEILLLDILMPGISGIVAAKRLRERMPELPVIFITGEADFVFEAFDVHAFHYLLKPFSDEKLFAVLDGAKEEVRRRAAKQKTAEAADRRRYVIVNSAGAHVRLCLDEIVFAEVFDARIVVHTTEGEIPYYGRLTALEKLTGEDFFRTHRSYLVHLKFVRRYDARSVELRDGTALLSKQRYPAFVKALLAYHKRKGLTA